MTFVLVQWKQTQTFPNLILDSFTFSINIVKLSFKICKKIKLMRFWLLEINSHRVRLRIPIALLKHGCILQHSFNVILVYVRVWKLFLFFTPFSANVEAIFEVMHPVGRDNSFLSIFHNSFTQWLHCWTKPLHTHRTSCKAERKLILPHRHQHHCPG